MRTVTMARCRCRTASGRARVVPEVYWYIAMSEDALSHSNPSGSPRSASRKASSATMVRAPSSGAAARASTGRQSSMRAAMASRPRRVNMGTATAPAFMAPKSAT